jgi:GNAT superfamily N-acetyltransferase
MNIILRPVRRDELTEYKKEMQRAFQLGAEAEFGETELQILPESDIDRSLNAEGAIAYAAVNGGEIAGGAIVVIDERTQHNHLDFLYVKVGVQSKGVGQAIWAEIERLHPDTRVWETCTPYFEKRNIHFYINRCGFHAVEFFNAKHPDPHECGKPNMGSDDDGCMFRFLKSDFDRTYEGFVCRDAYGKLITPNFVSDHFKNMVKKYGLRRLRFHDLRHSCASLLLANGESMKAIQDWLGHSTFNVTANFYSHLDYLSRISSAETIARVLGDDEDDENEKNAGSV